MATEITMPKLSDTMEEGKILRWLKQVGDQVDTGEIIAEVETDKADMELEASASGVLEAIRVAEGETATVGAVLALIGDGRAASPPPKKDAESRDASQPRRRPTSLAAPAEAAARTAVTRPKPVGSPPPPAPAAGGPRVSPLARRVATDKGVDLRQVRGSGAEGRITRSDVEAASDAPPRAAKPAAPPSAEMQSAFAAPEGDDGVRRVELSKMRQSIARRMAEAKRDIPHFYLTAEIEMSDAVRMLESLRPRTEVHLTITHVILKAVAKSLVLHPRLNGRLVDGAIELPATVNIGLVTAVDDGLLVPVVHGCERLSLFELATEASRLVTAAREGRFSGDDLKGGTFSVSNLGMMQIDEFAAVINPPQAAILAVAAVKERPLVRGGEIAVGKTMRVTLSCDHRQINGVEGGRFLEALKDLLENPVTVVMD